MSSLSICLIGNSLHFKEAITSTWPNCKLDIIAWRNASLFISSEYVYDFIFLAGYNYDSYDISYEDYYNSNIIHPLDLLRRIIKSKDTLIYYIMTTPPKKSWTFSRYLYAKNKLALIISSEFVNSKIIYLPTIIDSYGNMISFKPTNQLIFTFLRKIGFVKVVDKTNLSKSFLSNEHQISHHLLDCIPIALVMPRSITFDRILRLLIG